MRISDIRSWCGEAIEKIGAVTQFIPKVSGQDGTPITKLCGHQASLPCDLHQLHQVAYSFNCDGPWFPMRKATGSFAVGDMTNVVAIVVVMMNLATKRNAVIIIAVNIVTQI